MPVEKAKETPPTEIPEEARTPVEEEKFVPAKGDPSYETPSGHALSKVGAPDPDGNPSKEADRAAKYLSEKSKKRWGHG